MNDQKPTPAYLPLTKDSPLVVSASWLQTLRDGPKELLNRHIVPPRSGYAWTVKAGEVCRITTPEGPQVGDLNIWSEHNPRERFWASRTRQLHASHVSTGDRLWSCLPYLRPMLTIIDDTLGGQHYGVDEHGGRCHDLLGTRCDPYVDKMLSGEDFDFHCHSNLTRAVMPYGLTEFDVHDVLNVFQVTGLNADGKYWMGTSPATKSDYIEFFAEIDVLCALSTCPGGDLSKFGWGTTDEDMKATCRSLGVEVYRLEDQSLLRDWKQPSYPGYKGAHGFQSPISELFYAFYLTLHASPHQLRAPKPITVGIWNMHGTNVGVGLSPAILQDLYASQRYVDMKIVCDDGTVFPVCRSIVCAHSKTIEAAMNSSFREGQTNEYHLPGKESAVVKKFLNIMHGEEYKSTKFTSRTRTITDLTRQRAVLEYAKVYSLADELQADAIFEHCHKCIGWVISSSKHSPTYLNIMEAIQFVEANAVRTMPFYKVIMRTNFPNFPRPSAGEKAARVLLLTENQSYQFLLKESERRISFLEVVLGQYPGRGSFLSHYVDNPHFQELARQEDFATAVIEHCLTGGIPCMQDFTCDKRFTDALKTSPLAYDFLKDCLSEEWRVGESESYQCNNCSTVFLSGSYPFDNKARCDECETQQEMTPIAKVEFMEDEHELVGKDKWVRQQWAPED